MTLVTGPDYVLESASDPDLKPSSWLPSYKGLLPE